MTVELQATQDSHGQGRSIADEIRSSVKEKNPLTLRRVVTNEYFLHVVSVIAFVGLWHYVARNGVFSGALCTPWQVVEQFRSLMTDTLAGLTIWGHIWASTQRIFIGFVLASLVAIPLGLFMAFNPYVDAVVKPIFDIFKPMPPISWVSIAILWFGIDEASKIFIIVIGTFVPCLLNSYNGIRLIDPELYDVIKVLGGNRWNENHPGQLSGLVSRYLCGTSNFTFQRVDLRSRGRTGGFPLGSGLHHRSGHEGLGYIHGHRGHGDHRHCSVAHIPASHRA